MTAHTTFLAAAAVEASLALAGCGGGSDKQTGEGDRTVDVKLTDERCEPATLTLPAGPATFEVANDGADAVTEFEILDGDTILGEVENLAPGLSGHFSLTLKPGRYTMYCPGAKAERSPLVVIGEKSKSSAAAAAAVGRYRRYIEAQTALLVAETRRFAQKLQAHDPAAAKAAYVDIKHTGVPSSPARRVPGRAATSARRS